MAALRKGALRVAALTALKAALAHTPIRSSTPGKAALELSYTKCSSEFLLRVVYGSSKAYLCAIFNLN